MGRGKSWSREESKAVAKAWMKLPASMSSSHVKLNYTAELYRFFTEQAPNTDKSDGRWRARSQTAVKTQFEAISDDIIKFNAKLAKVVDDALSRSVQVSNNTILLTAIGLHIRSLDGPIDFSTLSTSETDWKLYDAWLALKSNPKYCPINFPIMRSPYQSSQHPRPHSSNGATATHIPQSSSLDNANGNYHPNSSHDLPSGGTPMRTLATAALSLEEVDEDTIPPLNIPVRNQQNSASIPKRNSIKTERLQLDNAKTGNAKKRSVENALQRETAPKVSRTANIVNMVSSGSNALGRVADALGALGDALSEYNAIALFSRADMQSRPDRQLFFDLMAEKHVLKARLDRDKWLEESRRREKRNTSTASGSR